MIPFTPLTIKLIAELICAALKVKLHKELSLWHELRAINVTHTGEVLLEDAVAVLVKHFSYSEKTAYRLLKAGEGKFWEIKGSKLSGGFGGRSVIKIYGLKKVAEYLGASQLSRPIEIKASDFRGHQAKTTQMYASFFKPEDSNIGGTQ